HCFAALAEHYGTAPDAIAAIYLGIHGDFGETIFPMGFHPGEKERFGPEGTGLPDFWCGSAPDRADFRRFAREKYGSLDGLNAAWGTDFASFETVGYPPAAYGTDPDVTSTAEVRRRWLDFVQWYFDSMTRFTGEVCRIARKHLPEAMLVLPLGGGAETLFYGQDNTALPKLAAELGVHIRSTHGGFQPFAQNYATMNRRIATASKVYGAPFWMEPPGNITPEQEVSRFMESVSCESFGFWDWGSNPVGAADTFREYAGFLTHEEALALDVALFFPTTDYRLHWNTAYPPRLAALGARLRDVMDFDIVDELLISDGALKRYRVLIWLEGTFIEAETLARLQQWVEGGGVILKLGADPPQTVEGDLAPGRALLGLTEATQLVKTEVVPLTPRAEFFPRHVAKADPRAETLATGLAADARPLLSAPNGEAAWVLWRMAEDAWPPTPGCVIVWAGADEGEAATATFCELARDTVYNLEALGHERNNTVEVDEAWDGVYTTVFMGADIFLLNPTREERTVQVGRKTVTLPPVSLRSVTWP
ncbi:MAG: glycosyl hydrolase family protein, partial [Armatimonadetes bacterium]|nr:glycosyl hydrolase family protein [Armatimonadota bacterium]